MADGRNGRERGRAERWASAGGGADAGNEDRAHAHDDARSDRRTFLTRGAMVAGLTGGYGGLGAIALRYLYPAEPEERAWQFVAEADAIEVGASLRYRGPSGETINIARQGRTGTVNDFVALSSTCPHLGCQVRWEAQNDRFFCPCHNGVFDPSGVAIGGPPGEAGQRLAQYPLKLEGGLLHIAVPTERLVALSGPEGEGTAGPTERLVAVSEEEDEGISGPGHDPCLCGRAGRTAEPRKV
jgi:Rieske Fe-S protein